MPDLLTPEDRMPYGDLAALQRLVTPSGRQTIAGPFMPIELNGPSPVCADDEYEVARFGGAMEIHGTFRDDDDGPDTLSLGQLAHGACQLLITSERMVCSIVHGATRAGNVSQEQQVVVFDYPWVLVDVVETPAKTSMTDRIAGGKPVRIAGFSVGAARFSFTVASTMSEPPGSAPSRKVKTDEAMKAIIGAAARRRMQDASAADAARLTSVLAGEYVLEDDDLTAYLVDPNGSPDEDETVVDEPTAATAVVQPAGPATGAAAALAGLNGTPATQELPTASTAPAPAQPKAKGGVVFTKTPEPDRSSPTPPAQPTPVNNGAASSSPSPQRPAPAPHRPAPAPRPYPPAPPQPAARSRAPRLAALALAALALLGLGAGGAVLATRGGDDTSTTVGLESGSGGTPGDSIGDGSGEITADDVSSGDGTGYDDGESSEPYDSNTVDDGTDTVDDGSDTVDDGTDTVDDGSGETPSPDGPSGILRTHLELLSEGDYDGAFALMSDKYQRKAARWPGLRAAADPAVSIDTVGPVTMGSGEAYVDVTFYARDRSYVKGSDTKCRRFSGAAHMVYADGVWRYDPRKSLDAVVLPNSNSNCP